MPPQATDHPQDDAFPRKVVRLAEQQGRKPIEFVIEPDAAGRAAIAQALDISGIRKLRIAGSLIPTARRDWRLEADLGATVVQPCVVTLAPVTTRIDEKVVRTYLSDLPPPAPGEVEMPEDDTIEPLPASLDLAEVMVEALALALPAYPRAPGADLGEMTVTAPGLTPLDADAVRPFAGLKAALGRKDDDEAS
jgi:uncharacterized metal-binding protein YceD (DUF177 family)